MLHNKVSILIKTETEYGSTPTPADNADVMEVEAVPEITPLFNDSEMNKGLIGYGSAKPYRVGEGVMIKFKMEFKPHGSSATTAPKLGRILRACNMTEAIAAAVTYTTNSTGEGDSVTIIFKRDGILHTILGCRGTFQLSGEVNKPWYITFEMTGKYGTLAAYTSFAAPTYSTLAVAPLLFRAAGITLLGAATEKVSKCDIDLGNTVSKRLDANQASGVLSYFISNRVPTVSIDPEVDASTPTDHWASLASLGTAALVIATTGGATGNKCTITVNRLFIESLAYAERDNIAVYDMKLKVDTPPGTADGDVSIVFA
jgi:hypothetical protein